MSQDNQKKNIKRSSLKMTPPSAEDILKRREPKRLSVGWDKSLNFKSSNMNKIKTSFDNSDEITVSAFSNEKSRNFREARRKSVQNEFGLARELLQKKEFQDELGENEEIILNTKKNFEFGKISVDSEEKTDNE